MTKTRRQTPVWTSVRRNKASFTGFVILGVVVTVAVAAPLLVQQDPNVQHLDLRRQPPSLDALLGRDAFGRDILSRLILGARVTLVASGAAVVLSLLIGSALGLLAGYRGGLIDSVVMRGLDLLLSIPYFLLVILVIAVAGPGLQNASLAIAIAYIPQYARVVRGTTLEVQSKEYIEAARAGGVSNLRIALTHVLPNVSAPIIVLSTVGMALAIIGVASLSFLGLGAQPPTPEWGAMLSDGREYLVSAPHITYFPGLCILLTVLSFNLVGDGLRDIFDPRIQ